MRFDFTIQAYKELLEEIKECGYNFFTMSDWLKNKPCKGVVIRHDVDRLAINSLRTAELEHKLNIQATYYFRMTKGSFRKEIIKKITGMGHEAGYHYEDLTMHGGDKEKAIQSFAKNLALLREHAEIRTIAMHGKPLSRINNLDLWKSYDFRDYEIEGEAYLTPEYSGIYYFSDTGRSWKSKSEANYKDYTNGLSSEKVVRTQDLKDFIRNERPDKLILMTHPERWSSTFAGLTYSKTRDFGIHFVKRILAIFRRDGHQKFWK